MVYTMYKFRYDFIHTMTKIQGGKLKNKSVFFFEGGVIHTFIIAKKEYLH